MKLLIYIFLVLFFTSCDIFDTREAEAPNQSKSNYVPAVRPETLVQNLINAFADKDVVSYQNSFVTELSDKVYNFVPSSSASLRFQNIWTNWDVDDEILYFNNMKATVPEGLKISLSLSSSPESFSIIGDSYKYTSEYKISVPQFSGDSLDYHGNLEISMTNVNTVWMIYYWKDNAIEDQPSWSDLKGSAY
jgi:hypothetical protein